MDQETERQFYASDKVLLTYVAIVVVVFIGAVIASGTDDAVSSEKLRSVDKSSCLWRKLHEHNEAGRVITETDFARLGHLCDDEAKPSGGVQAQRDALGR